jgi:hypothetical protein
LVAIRAFGRLVVALTALLLPAAIADAAVRTDGSTPAPAGIARSVTHVPARTLNQVGAGELAGPAAFTVLKLHSGPLKNHGKPELLTMNLAWCPHCAADSWSLAIALSRFGALTGLRVIDSGTHYCTLTSDPCALSAHARAELCTCQVPQPVSQLHATRDPGCRRAQP